MLNNLKIEGFKCFDKVLIPFKNLTLFTGTNSSGKSTVIQALLLLINNSTNTTTSPLNGMWLNLGQFDECRNHITNMRIFKIIAEAQGEQYSKIFSEGDDSGSLAEVKTDKHSNKINSLLDPKNQHTFYIPAKRVGVADVYQSTFDKLNLMGSNAEFVVDYLYRNRKKRVEEQLQQNKDSVTLETQVNHWLQKLLHVSINIIEHKGSNSYSVEYKRGDAKAVRPYHIGSGVSYALSVIISCLSAQKDDIVILENPEIHLHPKAQADLTGFLCFVANAGVQIIIETHSDHIFNGVRKAVALKDLDYNDISIQFFTLDDDGLSRNTEIELNEHGRVVNHQKGLFDQFDEDLDVILEL